MAKILDSPRTGIALGLLALAFSAGIPAEAAKTAKRLVTGAQIKNGTVSEADLNRKVRAKLAPQDAYTRAQTDERVTGAIASTDARIADAVAKSDVRTADALTRVDAVRLGGLEASAFAKPGDILPAVKAGDGPGSGVDSDSLDGRDSAEFATEGAPLRLGSEAGTTQGPSYPADSAGLTIRRAFSNSGTLGSIVARTDKTALVRDGTLGGLRFVRLAPGGDPEIINCLATDGDGSARNRFTFLSSASAVGTFEQVYTHADSVAEQISYVNCTFGGSGASSHTTTVVMHKNIGVSTAIAWKGWLTSTYDQ